MLRAGGGNVLHGDGRRRIKGQSTLEIVVAIIPLIIIILCTLNAFIWFNKRMVRRQRVYERTRVESGKGSVHYIDESPHPRLDVFMKWSRP
jgi:hypothetical protein